MRNLSGWVRSAFTLLVLVCDCVFAASLPQPLRAGIFQDCDGNYSAKVLFDRPLASNSSQAVANSGFESPSIGTTNFVQHNSGTLGAWTVNEIDVVSASYMAPDSGNQSIDMNMDVPGSIQQTLSTSAGQTVTLALSYTYNDQCFQYHVGTIPAQYMSEIVWNGKAVDTIRVASGTGRIWHRYSLSLVTQGHDALEIRSIVPGTCGNMLDDITVTSTTTSAQALGNSVVTLQRPDGTSLPQIIVPNTAVTFDAAGTTATLPLGKIALNSAYKGALVLQVSDGSGTFTSESVAVADSIGPWMDSARIAPNPQGNSTDSVYFWTSEPVTTSATWSFLVDQLGSAGSPSTTVPVAISSVAGSSVEYLALLPFGQLRNGDSLRLNPATTSDLHDNVALDCHRNVPLSILSRTLINPALPTPIRAGVFLDCGGKYSVKVIFDKPFSSGSSQFVSNSGFETPSLGSSSFGAYTSGTLGAWTVSNIDLVSSGFLVPDSGNQALDMNMVSPGRIEQTLPTTAGQSVLLQLSYSYNNRSLSPAPVMMTQILWNGIAIDTLQYASNATPIWKRISIPLVAKGTDILVFQSINQGDAGITLDDITVTSTTTSAQALGNSVVTLQRPDGTSLPQITIPNTAITFDAAGTTAVIPLGSLTANSAYKGNLTVQVSDGSGTFTSESVAVADSIGPWMDSVRIAPNPLGTSTDSVYFWTSEPVTTSATWSFLVDHLSSASGSASTTVPVTASLVNASSNEYLAVLPAGQLRNGDSLRLNPATTSDLHGNTALDCHRNVPLSILARTTSNSSVPKPLRAGIFLDCGGTYTAKVLFDKPFSSGSAQMVDNSGFEVPTLQFPSGAAANTMFQEYFGATLGGWTVDNIDLVAAGYMSPDSGVQSIDLNGNAPGFIQQTLATKAGQNVVVHFGYTYNHSCIDLSGPPPSSAAAYTSQVLWNGIVVGSISVPSGTARTWTRDSLSLVAQGSDVLRIQSTTQGMCGNMLDDITVTSTTTSAQALGNSVVNLQRPDGTSLPQITVPNTAVTFDAAGTTATFPLGKLPPSSAYSGNLSIQISDSTGTWVTKSVAVDDSIGPWVDSARIEPNPQGNATDSVFFWTSEPVLLTAGWPFLVDRSGAALPTSDFSGAKISLVDASTNKYLVLLPVGELASGDSLRLNPATTSDLHGNTALACHQDVPLSMPAPPLTPVHITVQTIPYIEEAGKSSRSGAPVQIWVRRKGDVSWIRTDGSSVSDTSHVVGAVVTANTRLGGTAYIYDNAGVFATSGNLSPISVMAAQSRLPRDSSGAYQIKIGWDGRLEDGTWASSGIYVVRLVLLYHTPETPKTKVVNNVFRVGIKRASE